MAEVESLGRSVGAGYTGANGVAVIMQSPMHVQPSADKSRPPNDVRRLCWFRCITDQILRQCVRPVLSVDPVGRDLKGRELTGAPSRCFQ